MPLWRDGAGRCVATLQGHGYSVTSVAALEGGLLASGSADRTVKVWEVASGRCIATLQGHGSYVTSVAALEGGRLASGSGDDTVKVWDGS